MVQDLFKNEVKNGTSNDGNFVIKWKIPNIG